MINHKIAAELLGGSTTLMALRNHIEYSVYGKRLVELYSEIKKKNGLKSVDVLMDLSIAELMKEKGGISTVIELLKISPEKMSNSQLEIYNIIAGDLKTGLIQAKKASNSEYISIFEEDVYADLKENTRGKQVIGVAITGGRRAECYAVVERMMAMSKKKEHFAAMDNLYRSVNLSSFESEIDKEIEDISKEMDRLVLGKPASKIEDSVKWAEFKQVVLIAMEEDSDYQLKQKPEDVLYHRRAIKKSFSSEIQNNFISQRAGIGKKILESSLTDGLQIEVDAFKERMFLQEGKEVVEKELEVLVNVSIIGAIEQQYAGKMSESDRTGILKLADGLRVRIDGKPSTQMDYANLMLMLVSGKSNQIESLIKKNFSEDIVEGVMEVVKREILRFRDKRVYNRTEHFSTSHGMNDLMTAEMSKFSKDFFAGNNSAVKSKEPLNDLAKSIGSERQDSLYFLSSEKRTKEEMNEELFEVAIGSSGVDKEKNLFQIYESDEERTELSKKIIRMLDAYIQKNVEDKDDQIALLSMPIADLLTHISDPTKAGGLKDLRNALVNSGYMTFMKEFAGAMPPKTVESRRGKDLIVAFDDDVTYAKVGMKLKAYAKANKENSLKSRYIDAMVIALDEIRKMTKVEGDSPVEINNILAEVLADVEGKESDYLLKMGGATGSRSEVSKTTLAPGVKNPIFGEITKIITSSEAEMTLEDFIYMDSSMERKTESFVTDVTKNTEPDARKRLLDKKLAVAITAGAGKKIVLKGSNAYSEPKLQLFFETTLARIKNEDVNEEKGIEIWKEELDRSINGGLGFNIEDFEASILTVLDPSEDYKSLLEIASLPGKVGERYSLITKNKLMGEYLKESGRAEDINSKLITDERVSDGLSYLKVANEHNIDQYNNLINATRAMHMTGYKSESENLEEVFGLDEQIAKAVGSKNIASNSSALVNFGNRSSEMLKDGDKLMDAWKKYSTTATDKTNQANRDSIKTFYRGEEEVVGGIKDEILSHVFHLNDVLTEKGKTADNNQQMSLNFEVLAMIKNTDAAGKKQELGSLLEAIKSGGGLGVQKYLNIWANTKLKSKDGKKVKEDVDKTRSDLVTHLNKYEKNNPDTLAQRANGLMQNVGEMVMKPFRKPV